jgi:hypothetical protein
MREVNAEPPRGTMRAAPKRYNTTTALAQIAS